MSAASKVARFERDRLRGVRARLAVLIEWTAVRACSPNVGRPLSRDIIEQDEVLVADELSRMADAGIFLFFGIRSGDDLGEAPVTIFAVDDARHRHGTIALHLPPLVQHIVAGGDLGAGWKSPSEVRSRDLRDLQSSPA